MWRKILSPPDEIFQREIYQKMRRKQGYNISKIQPGTSYFDITFVHDTEIWWPKLHTYFFKFNFFPIKNGIQKIIEIGDFVEKKILYHLRRPAPQTIKLWVKKSKNTTSIEKTRFLGLWKNMIPAIFL